MKFLIKIILFFFLITSQVKANQVENWLQTEIDIILNAFKNNNISNVDRFKYIETTIDQNFAGAGISKFVAGKAWATADKEIKKNYIRLFKRHLALNIASLMKGYSNQEYSLINSSFDEKNKIAMIDMEIRNDTNTLIITWRVKKSKDRFFVIDLIVADISLVVTKRSEFNSMLKKTNYDLVSFNKILDNQNNLSYNKIIK